VYKTQPVGYLVIYGNGDQDYIATVFGE